MQPSPGFLVDNPWWHFALAALFAAGLSGWLYFTHRLRDEVPRRITIALSIIRFVTLFFLALLAFDIFIKHTVNKTEPPTVLIAVDNSQSMVSGRDSGSVRSELPAALSRLRSELSSKYQVRTLLLSGGEPSEQISFTAKETDLDQLLRDAENNFSNQNIGAMVLVSDGIYNKGASPAYTAERLQFPVYTLAVGDTVQMADAAIQKVIHNQVAYQGNSFPVEVVVSSKRQKGATANITLTEGGAIRGTSRITIPSDDYTGTVTFTLNADKPGVVKYKAAVTVTTRDNNVRNNEQSFVIEVIDAKKRILVIAAAPHPDIMALRSALETFPSYAVEYVYSQSIPEVLKAYALVIIHGFSISEFPTLELCRENGIPVWLIDPSTPENLPGLRVQNTLGRFNDAEPVINRTFGLFTVSEGLEKLSRQLPAVQSFFGNYQVANGSAVLFRQRLGSVETDNPMMIFTESSGWKSSVFIGDGLWRWSMRDFTENNSRALFNEFTGKTVQWLSLRNDRSFFRLTVPSVFNENESPEFNAEVYNKSYEYITQPDVTMEIFNARNEKFSYLFSKDEKSYRLSPGLLAPGEYRYEASVTVDREKYTKKGTFAVREMTAEHISTVANHRVLAQVARRSGGRFFFRSQADSLREALLGNENIKAITYSESSTVPLTGLAWIFWILLVLFAAEWFVRKRYYAI